MIAREQPKNALSPPAITAQAALDRHAHEVDELARGPGAPRSGAVVLLSLCFAGGQMRALAEANGLDAVLTHGLDSD